MFTTVISQPNVKRKHLVKNKCFQSLMVHTVSNMETEVGGFRVRQAEPHPPKSSFNGIFSANVV